jgi:hypothetical protein
VSAYGRMGVSAFAGWNEFRRGLVILSMSRKAIFRCRRPVRRRAGTRGLLPVLFLAGSMLLGGCAESSNTGKKEQPVLFGNAGGGTGGGGAMSGMSFSW